MIEQQRLAQERLIAAAQRRKTKVAVLPQKLRDVNWCQPYLMTVFFVVSLFGVHLLHLANVVEQALEIVIVFIYYCFLVSWVRASVYGQRDKD
ncbi:MAG TPA: hypothetical protein VJZ27_17570 [Aggregatilineales bacterium]|nr:hypothetical protein [Aggregatilineales bacterium]